MSAYPTYLIGFAVIGIVMLVGFPIVASVMYDSIMEQQNTCRVCLNEHYGINDTYSFKAYNEDYRNLSRCREVCEITVST